MDARRPVQSGLTFEEYLARELTSEVRHEYLAGEIFAMTGTTTRHNVIGLNIAMHLRTAVKRSGCRVFMEAVMLRAAEDRAYYPDIIVACGQAAEVERVIEAPSLVVEVTSPGTRATDRREKLEAYRRIATLRAYLIVEQRRRHVLAYLRDRDGGWARHELQGDGEVELGFLATRLTLDQIYEDVTLPPLGVGEGDEELEWAEVGEEG
jgi:Uma2 family endonuclease